MRSPFEPAKSQKELYKEKYEASKKGGEPFFPDTVAKDAIVALVVVAVIIGLAIFFPPHLEPAADPASTTYNPRPEWYFLFFFQFLKLFPGNLEPVAAVIIPTIAIIVLILIPLLHRGPDRAWSRRKGMLGAGVVVLLILVALEVGGALSAPSRPAGEESHAVQLGRDVYREINCGYCHSINGIGGNIGPDLSTVGSELDPSAIASYLQNPHAMVPTTLHPKLLFTDEELQALVAYLSTLGATVSYSDQAPALFESSCAACHAVNGKGGTIGPDLSKVGDYRTMKFLNDFTSDPASVLPGSTMPAFKDSLTEAEIRDIAAYLSSLKSESETGAGNQTETP